MQGGGQHRTGAASLDKTLDKLNLGPRSLPVALVRNAVNLAQEGRASTPRI